MGFNFLQNLYILLKFGEVIYLPFLTKRFTINYGKSKLKDMNVYSKCQGKKRKPDFR